MNRAIVILTVLIGAAFTSYVAADQKPIRDGEKQLKELNLTDEQKKEVKTIRTDFGQKIQAVKKSRIAPEAQKLKIENLRTEQKTAIENILTAEQKIKFGEISSNKIERKGKDSSTKHARTNKMNTHGSIWMLAGIEMSEEQKTQYKAIAEQFKDENKDLAGENAKEREALKDKQIQAINDLLTPEQQAIFKENRAKISDNTHNNKKDNRKGKGSKNKKD